jgi:hypothetical protein
LAQVGWLSGFLSALVYPYPILNDGLFLCCVKSTLFFIYFLQTEILYNSYINYCLVYLQ